MEWASIRSPSGRRMPRSCRPLKIAFYLKERRLGSSLWPFLGVLLEIPWSSGYSQPPRSHAEHQRQCPPLDGIAWKCR